MSHVYHSAPVWWAGSAGAQEALLEDSNSSNSDLFCLSNSASGNVIIDEATLPLDDVPTTSCQTRALVACSKFSKHP